ncbi:MAG: transpeptidase family protein [Bacteriovoracaceae bacterium]|nr:transpeptidase family protein [Bacteriovoracaceae bacterium]
MKTRIIFLFLSLCLCYFLVIVKAVYVQVINKNKLIQYSESQFFRKVKRYPKRGNILDRNSQPLAINIKTYGLFVIPKNIKNKYDVARRVEKIIPEIDKSQLLKKLKNRNKYTWIKRKMELTDTQVMAVKELDGVYLEEETRRFYPNGEISSQVLGIVNVDNSGLEGVEYYFDEQLKGKAEEIKYYRDAKGRPIKFESHHAQNRTEDLVLSIDKDIQAALEKYLKEGVIEHEAKSAGAGVMDVETGEIWAVANYPNFDPNKPNNAEPSSRKLSFVTDPFEPGSVFKAITVASALENRIVNESTNYYCEKGKFHIGKHTINEADNEKIFEWLSVSQILQYSSNIGTTKIAFDLGFPRLKKTIEDFGIGSKTGIEIPGESRGIFNYDEKIKQISLSNVSFGQGIATTGIQILSAYAAIANGGHYVRPTLIKNRSEADIEKNRIISTQSASRLEEMLIKAVNKGTGGNASVPHFIIAGKTGTAQRVSPEGGYKGYVSGFVGYPVNVRKRFAIFVYVDNPSAKGYYGNLVAAPIFQKLTQYILFKNKEFQNISDLDNTRNNNIINNIKTSLSAHKRVDRETIPSFVGLDKKTAIELATDLSLNIRIDGFGIVKSQFPMAGTKLEKGSLLRLILSPPVYE